MRKLVTPYKGEQWGEVSVPLRGLDMRKLPDYIKVVFIGDAGFSPLAGIRYAETPPSET